MVEIILSKCTQDNNVVSKTYTDLSSMQCELKTPSSIINPVVIVQGNALGFNTAHIPIFNRDYFIKDIIVRDTNICELRLEIDVLNSWHNQIKNLVACVERQEFKQNSAIIDNEIIQQANNNFYCRQVGGPVLDDYNIFLTTCGGTQ